MKFRHKYKVKLMRISHVTYAFLYILCKADGFSYVSDRCTTGEPERSNLPEENLSLCYVLSCNPFMHFFSKYRGENSCNSLPNFLKMFA